MQERPVSAQRGKIIFSQILIITTLVKKLIIENVRISEVYKRENKRMLQCMNRVYSAVGE